MMLHYDDTIYGFKLGYLVKVARLLIKYNIKEKDLDRLVDLKKEAMKDEFIW